jgi:peptidoglycan hydrolase-like protein with peptidoglycan-binding domain
MDLAVGAHEHVREARRARSGATQGDSMNYTLLRAGDRLPMVGVLQVLLNRAGASVASDGMFGPKTLAALQALQRSHKLVPDGIVGERTWTKLATGAGLPIVDSVDVFDSNFLREDARYLRQSGGNPFLIGGACSGVQQAVANIRSAAGKNVFLLRFHGHGNAGLVDVAGGHGELDANLLERAKVSANRAVLDTMATLRPIFGPYGCLEFMSCKTGRGLVGRDLLTKLANGLGVPVTAALNSQAFGATTTFRLTGPTVTVTPRGTLRDWCQSLPPLPKASMATVPY